MKKIAGSTFKRLLGTWNTSGEVQSDKDTQKLSGTDTYELILEGNYILHKAAVKIGSEPSETLEIMQLDETSDKAKMQYFNSKTEEGIMFSTIVQDEFSIEGKELKFQGTINEENTKITGKWYRQTEDGKWIDFMDLILEK